MSLQGFGELEKQILQRESGESRSAGGEEGQSWQGRLVWLGPRGWGRGQQERGRLDPSHGLPTKPSSLFPDSRNAFPAWQGAQLGKMRLSQSQGPGRGFAFLLKKQQGGHQPGGLTIMWACNSALVKYISFSSETFCDLKKNIYCLGKTLLKKKFKLYLPC